MTDTLVQIPRRQMTAEEFGAEYGHMSGIELVDGYVERKGMPGAKQGRTGSFTNKAFLDHVENADSGRLYTLDTFIQLKPNLVRGADVAFVSYERMPREIEDPDGALLSIPELVVEVKSPTDNWKKITRKIAEYLDAGVKVVMVVEPAMRTATLCRKGELHQVFDNGDDLVIPDVLPGFSVKLAKLFG